MSFESILNSMHQTKEYDVKDLTRQTVKPMFNEDQQLIARIVDHELVGETVIESIVPKSQVLNLRLMDKYKSELTTVERL